jgi:hypothetical protein
VRFAALIRIEGAREASVFAFRVADRVTGGVVDPTPIHPTTAAPVRPTPSVYRWAVLIAFVAGVLLGRAWP